MGIGFNPLRLFANQTAKVQPNKNYYLTFGNQINNDSFQNNSVERFYDEKNIKTMLNANPELKKILNEHKLSENLNMKELLELKKGHCKDCREICVKLYKILPPALKNQIDLRNLKDAAMLHDFGKVLIPSEILNKPDKLTEEEYKIMQLHSEIGYQLLKNSSLNNEVLSLIRNHHHNTDNKNFVPDINLQILNLADKYSALTENRIYKQAFTPKQALTSIYGDVRRGEVHPILYKALIEAVNEEEQETKPILSDIETKSA